MNKSSKPLFNLRSSIYGRVVITITVLSLFFFVSFGIIFRSVNKGHLTKVCQQSGSNIGSIVEGALYHSMLANDRSALENTLDVINDLPGIEDVNMYDSLDNLVYSSYSDDPDGHSNPNCKDCHLDLNSMFPRTEKSFRIINIDSECEMTNRDYSYSLLMINSPILNQPSCYTASCHAHQKSDEVLGSFVIRIPLEALDTAVKQSSRDFFLLAAFSTLLLVTFLMFFTRRKINRPLNQIISASEAVSRGDRSTRLKLDSSQLKDVQLVSKTFNKMLDNLQAATEELQDWSQQLEDKVQRKSEELTEMQNELIHVERIASLGKLSSSVAHEINNPLSGVLTYTKLVHKQLGNLDLDDSEKLPMLKYLKVIEEETKRCGDIVKGLLDFSRKDQLEFNNSSLHKILQESFLLMEHQMKVSNIDFMTDLSANRDLIHCSENQIKQACIAVLLNASEAVIENGEILIKTSMPDEDHIKLEITDNGTGIAPGDIPHIFEPFFSAKEKVSGIGLGLAIVHGIVQSHNGKVDVKSELGMGTTVSIILPLVKDLK
ncbi:MAG: HAMP domain-containing protein [Bacteroidales bacterium]|nr:HAMP domain-containing protein [Bacteroidales bacterium]